MAPTVRVPITAVRRLDQMPGRRPGIRPANHALGDLDEFTVELVVSPIRRRHPALAVRVILKFFEPFPLGFLGDVEPQFDNQGAIIHQHFLEERHPLHRGVQFGALDLAIDLLENRIRVPRAKQDREPGPRAGRTRQNRQ